MLLFAVGSRLLGEVDQFALVGSIAREFGKRGNRVTADFFLRIVEKRAEPGFNFGELICRVGFGEDNADGANDGDAFEAFARRGGVKARNFARPEFVPG